MSTTSKGLEDVVAAESRICDLDGQLGKLTYFGVDIHDLANHSTFEETAYLLWHGKLPTQAQLDEIKQQFCSTRTLPTHIVELMRFLPAQTSPLNVLRTTLSLLDDLDDISGTDEASNLARALRMTSVMPTLMATWEHVRNGSEPVPPLADGSHAANFLYMLRGEPPDEAEAHMMDVAFLLHADHELNASTFAARVAAGTLANMYAAAVAAISTLSGPLHGGANEQVIRMLQRIGDVEHVDSYLDDALARKERIMGFGHRVYRTEDPRATHLRAMSKELGERKGDTRWYDMSQKIEEYIKAKKGLNANVDFYSASLYYSLGIPIDLDTPIFASARMAGWTAHVLEQYANNRLIRPRAEYIGPKVTPYIPIEQRS